MMGVGTKSLRIRAMSTAFDIETDVDFDHVPITRLGPEANGTTLSPEEFDAVDEWDHDYRYELIRGVVIVSAMQTEAEADLSDELGHRLRNYQTDHPQGRVLDNTLPQRYVYLPDGSRRRADRSVWLGLGRRPRRRSDVPAIVIEFVSKAKRDWRRDFIDKRREYREAGVKEYWVIDRFRRQMTVFRGRQTMTFKEGDVYTTELLPGFKLPLAKLFAIAADWEPDDE
jgi:Uma2 family endonuclease